MFSIADSKVPRCVALAVGDSSIGGQSARVLVWYQTRRSISARMLSSVSAGRSAAEGEWSGAYGLYVDRYRRDGGRWRFAQRRYRSLARVVAPPGTVSEVFPIASPPDGAATR